MGSNRFMDGLLWGMLLGGAAVFLFGTKKGKKLLDIITEEGAEGLSKVISEIENDLEDVEEEMEPDLEEKEVVKDLITQKLEKINPTQANHKSKTKRFFSSSKKSL